VDKHAIDSLTPADEKSCEGKKAQFNTGYTGYYNYLCRQTNESAKKDKEFWLHAKVWKLSKGFSRTPQKRW